MRVTLAEAQQVLERRQQRPTTIRMASQCTPSPWVRHNDREELIKARDENIRKVQKERERKTSCEPRTVNKSKDRLL